MPVYNGAVWIGEAIDSVLAQTMLNLELVVVDDNSSDDTMKVVRERADSRLRLVENQTTLGVVANHNRCIQLARGQLIKFLHQDDILFSTCLERMTDVFARHITVGLCFTRRKVLLDDPADADAVKWERTYAILDRNFASLTTFNRGSALLDAYVPALRRPPIENWIGEPSAVMVRRSCFERTGLFNIKMRQSFDVEMWLRIMAASDVGFVDEPVVAYRHHRRSLTNANARQYADWLDLVWLYEGILRAPELRRHSRAIKRFRRRELARTLKRQLGRVARGSTDPRPLADYFLYRAARIIRRDVEIHAALGDE